MDMPESPKKAADGVVRKISKVQDDIMFKLADFLPDGVAGNIAGTLVDVKSTIISAAEGLPDPVGEISRKGPSMNGFPSFDEDMLSGILPSRRRFR